MASETSGGGRRSASRRVLHALGLVLVWAVVAVPLWAVLFTHSSTEMVLASHDAVVHPTFDGEVHLDMGPYVPDLRTPSDSRLGVFVEMRKTNASSTSELAARYAAIAARPGAEVRAIKQEVVGLARDAALRAAGLGLVPIGVWFLLGARRRAELRQISGRAIPAGVAIGAVVVLLVVQPWRPDADRVQGDVWLPVQDAVPELTVPEGLQSWQIQGGLITKNSRRLLLSLFDTYDRSKVFYAGVREKVDEVVDQLHQPTQDQTVAVQVSDRHDNIGMDQVVRDVADEAGATVVLDTGDDTSTGEPWEEFSLDSLDSAFEGYDARVAISGNHDNGTFVNQHLQDQGWTHLDGSAEQPFADVRVWGVDDPRSSGLGTWRDETGDLTFPEVEQKIADEVCALDEEDKRVATLLVHDANLGRAALARGCTDLVLSGHLHRQVGPTRVEGENGKVGYTYTNGTTGGAAYAIAVGSKLRRDAEFTLVTYADGRPVGLQPVTVTTGGKIEVAPYVPFELG